MADTQTDNYELTLVEVGGSTNTWGGKLNTNFSLLDSVIKGVADAAAAALAAAVAALSTTYATKSELSAALPPGVVFPYAGSVAPTGYLMVSGLTISKAGSGGTARANADVEALYLLLWETYANTELPIQNSAGVATTRGLNAAADFAAGKRLPLLDAKERVLAGWGGMGGGSPGRLTGATVIGSAQGSKTHTLTEAELAVHAHGGVWTGGSVTDDQTDDGSRYHIAAPPNTNGTSDTAGSGAAHNNVQPTLILPFIIRYAA